MKISARIIAPKKQRDIAGASVFSLLLASYQPIIFTWLFSWFCFDDPTQATHILVYLHRRTCMYAILITMISRHLCPSEI